MVAPQLPMDTPVRAGAKPHCTVGVEKGKQSETPGVRRKAGLLWVFFFLTLTLTTNELHPFALFRASHRVLGS